MNDLMQKLAISKKIMDKHNETPRGQMGGNLPMNEEVNANYNIPQEIIQQPIPQQMMSQNTSIPQPISENSVLNSRLPDEIKRLMIENPIIQPQMSGPTLSDELVEGAARLMNIDKSNRVTENKNSNTNNNDLKQMIRDVVRDTVRDVVREELRSSGLISESAQNTNETLSLRVGKHIFEGKVLKIKKVKQ